MDDSLQQAALEELVTRVVKQELKRSVDRRMLVQAVNTDGTVNLDAGDGQVIPSQPALNSYTNRQPGDVVLTRVRGGEFYVQGTDGSGLTIPAPSQQWVPTVSDAAPPTGQGWDAIVSGSVWARTTPPYLWLKRVTAAPPVTGGTVTRTSTSLITYRGGGVTQSDIAEQGDYSGRGLQTGLATFGTGAWTALSGKTVTGGTLTIHRDKTQHGFSYGPQTATIYRALATDAATTPPALIDGQLYGQLALNQTLTIAPSAAWLQAFAAATASAIAFYSTNARDNVQIDGVTLAVTYA